MKILKEGDKVTTFLKSLKESSHQRLIMLDYDGTLAPFVADPQCAIPYQGVVELLNAVSDIKKNRLVIVTGRNAPDILKFLPLNHPFEVFGGHGAERLTHHGELIRVSLHHAAEKAFVEFKEWAVNSGLERCVEEKYGSIAFHTRGLPEEKVSSSLHPAKRKMKELAQTASLEVKDFDGGIELKVPYINKGKVVDTLVSEAGPHTLSTYLGDDLTDEDAFKALGDRGVSVLVRPTLRPTAADSWIIPPDELKMWLARFII